MTQDDFDKWIAALRSDKYYQVKGRYVDRQYGGRLIVDSRGRPQCCAVGVALVALYYTEVEEGKPLNLLDLGFTTEAEGEIIGLNDAGDYTFEQIADWLEEHRAEYITS